MVFSVNTPLKIIHNFHDFPDRERERALSSEYREITHNNLNYRGISELKEDPDEKRIERLLNLSPGKWTTFYRRYLENEENETYIHNDCEIGELSAILFLNTKEQCQGGTAFWKYKQYGWNKQRRSWI